jgi:hypothetical protein
VARDWVAWHSAYEDPGSSQSNRLVIVQQLIRHALDAARPGPVRVLSLCAGDSRDIVGAAADHPRAQDISGALIEFDERLASAAQDHVATAELALDVRCDDASDPEAFADVLPVDLLLLVGIFGNISDDDVASTIEAVPAMCKPQATVIWTRHRRDPDLTPRIRQWFDGSGCSPVDFRSPKTGGFAVGSERLAKAHSHATLPSRLFTFRDDLC